MAGVSSYFLKGNYAPVSIERTDELVVLEGNVPGNLSGAFLRNGPNPLFPPKGDYHWFEGDGMLHCSHFHNGKVVYRNRWVQTMDIEFEKKYGSSYWSSILASSGSVFKGAWSLGSLVLQSITSYIPYFGGRSSFSHSHTANTATIYHDRRFLALMEVDKPHWVHLPSVDTVGRYNYEGKLMHPFTAHPKIDQETGEMFFFGYRPTAPFVCYSAVSATGEKAPSIGINTPLPTMMHDFAITKSYAIFFDLGIVFDVKNPLQGKNLYSFDPNFRARIGIIPRSCVWDNVTGDKNKDHNPQYIRKVEAQWFDISACYIFHVANSWEGDFSEAGTPQSITIYAVRYEKFSLDFLGNYELSKHEHKSLGGVLYEYKLNLCNGTVTERPVTKHMGEFPVVNELYCGRPCQYTYLTLSHVHEKRFSEDPGAGIALMKYDFSSGKEILLNLPEGHFAGEFVFVPVSQSGEKDLSKLAEDEGYLVSYIFDKKLGTSELLVLRAQDLKVKCRLRVPQRVPYGFHGRWVTNQQLLDQRSPS